MTSTKILIVDDELIMRESLAGWLERDGKQVLEKIFSCQDLPTNQPQKELAAIKSFY